MLGGYYCYFLKIKYVGSKIVRKLGTIYTCRRGNWENGQLLYLSLLQI